MDPEDGFSARPRCVPTTSGNTNAVAVMCGPTPTTSKNMRRVDLTRWDHISKGCYRTKDGRGSISKVGPNEGR